MLVDQKIRLRTRLQHILFVLLLLGIVGLLAYLSTRYEIDADWTASGRNSLSLTSVALLEQMPEPITISSYATEDPALRRAISDVIQRYQRQKPDLVFRFINPDLVPDKVRELGISGNGELLIEYQQRHETLKDITESGITNTLQRLARGGERWLVFLQGHGERKPDGQANHDLGTWVNQLKGKGFQVQGHNLAAQPQLPDNTRVLVVASPQLELLPGEVAILKNYIADGGNLLWLTEPELRFGLGLLDDSFGITLQPGVIVDPSTQVLGISDPRFAVVANYARHDITSTFDTITLFPQAVGFKLEPFAPWELTELLSTQPRSWSESGPLAGKIQFDSGSDVQGPLPIGVALSRQLDELATQTPRQQRVVVIGDGDFLSNAYLGNAGNLKLGLNLINWLAHDDRFIDIPEKIFVDKQLNLSATAQLIIASGFLFVLPLLLAGIGFFIWWRRRRL